MKGIIPEGFTSLEISKIKLNNNKVNADLACFYETESGEVVSLQYQVASPLEIHEDFKSVFSELALHVAFICELLDPNAFNSGIFDEQVTDTSVIRLLQSITVTGISFGGSDEHFGVTIIAQKSLRGGKVLNLITPFTKLEHQEHQDNYKFLSELSATVGDIEHEFGEYMKGKHSGAKQLDLFDETKQVEA